MAARVREARGLLGLSQGALASELGLGKKGHGSRTVQAWERNERSPRIEALTRLGELVDRPVAWFYAADEDIEAERKAA